MLPLSKPNILLSVKHGSDDTSRKIINVTDVILKTMNMAEISIKNHRLPIPWREHWTSYRKTCVFYVLNII